MQDFTLTSLLFASFVFSLLILGGFILHFRLLNHDRILANKYLKTLKKHDLPFFYSTHAVIAESRNKFFGLPHKQEIILCRTATKSLSLSAPLIRRAIQKSPQNFALLLLDTEVSLLLNKQADFLHLVEQLNLPSFCPAHLKAKYLLLTAKAELYQTDMLSASSHASRALKIYQRLGYTYEEADCYQTLAQMYRISGVFDVAFTMLKEAKKLYKEIKLTAKIAETEAYFGLTEIGRENYKPANEYLRSAEKICLKYHLYQTLADICNWQGLAALLTEDLPTALQKLTAAFNNSKTLATQSFAAEMRSRLYLKQKHYTKALKEADTALNLYRKQRHKPGIFEALYLKAEIYYIQKNYPACRTILTALIKEKTPPSAIYYPANAYTLLGALELKEHNSSQARTLFKQAADLEHAQNRLKGAALDYNNLAELERQEGSETLAKTYLEQAIRYAEEIEDEELKSYLQAKLK